MGGQNLAQRPAREEGRGFKAKDVSQVQERVVGRAAQRRAQEVDPPGFAERTTAYLASASILQCKSLRSDGVT